MTYNPIGMGGMGGLRGPHGGDAKPKPTKEELAGDKINKHRGNAVIAGVVLLVFVGIPIVAASVAVLTHH